MLSLCSIVSSTLLARSIPPSPPFSHTSESAKKLGRPSGFKINVREVYASAGAGFVVAVNGSIMTMPGLSKKPAAYGIDVDDNGVITGLF